MRPRSWPRISSSSGRRRNDGPRRSGAISLIAVFLFFLYSCLGLGLVWVSEEALRIAGARRDALRLECAAECGVKDALAALTGAVDVRTEAALLTPERLEALRADAAAAGRIAAESAANVTFPFRRDGSTLDLAWAATASCGLERWREEDGYAAAAYVVSIDGRGRISGKPAESQAALELEMTVLAGRLPLAFFPLLLAGSQASETAAILIDSGRLSFAPARRPGLRPRGLASSRLLVPRNASRHLAEALKVRLLEPDGIRLDLLRQALGLPVVNEPVPDGVYLVRSDTGPGGIFVQGSLDRLLLAVEGDRQVIGFESEAGAWTLSFRPGLGPTEFQTPSGTILEEHAPLGVLLVNGAVGSLTAARVDGTGSLVPSPDAGLPCLRDGQALTIVSTDELVIDSDLLFEGVRWAESVPYLRDRQSQLVVYAAGQDLVSGAETRGAIRIGSNAPGRVRLQASLSASGAITIDGGAKDVLVSGGLQAAALGLGASRLTIAPDDRMAEGSLTPVGPAATEPVLMVLGLRPRAWREGI